jgi:hypothetical protein
MVWTQGETDAQIVCRHSSSCCVMTQPDQPVRPQSYCVLTVEPGSSLRRAFTEHFPSYGNVISYVHVRPVCWHPGLVATRVSPLAFCCSPAVIWAVTLCDHHILKQNWIQWTYIEHTMRNTLPSQSVVALPFPPYLRHALLSAGISSIADIRGVAEQELMHGKHSSSSWWCCSSCTAHALLHTKLVQQHSVLLNKVANHLFVCACSDRSRPR